MPQLLLLPILAVGASGCGIAHPAVEPVVVKAGSCTLIAPEQSKATLVLFPCFSCDAADTQAESLIPEEAVANGIAVLLMEFNQRVFLSEGEERSLIDTIAEVLGHYHLNSEHVVFGGFSSGGNLATLLARRLGSRPDQRFHLSGLFVVDSPLDLSHLYRNCAKRIGHPNPGTAEEAPMVVDMLGRRFGHPDDSVAVYERWSPISASEASIAPLKDIAVRLSTEPDTAWWLENRGVPYADLNAARLEGLRDQFVAMGHVRAELIKTNDRGVQHGNRHPHAWSIVEEKELVRWVLALE